MQLTVSEDARTKLSGLSIGYIVLSGMKNGKNSKAVDAELEECAIAARSRFKSTDEISSDATLKAVRAIFSSAGTDPTKDRPSGEALMRRTIRGEGVYRINDIVDINNLISLETGFPCGVYDLKNFSGQQVVFGIGKKGESYEGIGGKMVNAESRIITSDAAGIFGSPVADSKRTSVGPDTNDVLMLVYAPTEAGPERLKASISRAIALFTAIAGAKKAEGGIFAI